MSMNYQNGRYFDPQIALIRKVAVVIIIGSLISIGSNMILLLT